MIKLRNLKVFEDFNERNAAIVKICKKYRIEDYSINPDGSIDVDGNVSLFDYELSKLPLNFGRVSGYFDCTHNRLTTLEGSPSYVGLNFDCGYNRLSSFEYCPDYIGKDFKCYSNVFTSLKGAPKEVIGTFFCYDNPLPQLIKINQSDIKYIVANQDDYGIWNKDGSFNELRFNIMMKDINI